MIKLVAFDLDGTIGDTIPMCLKALKKAVTPYVTLSLFPFADANVSNTTYDYNLGHISYRYFGKKRLQAQRFQQFIPTFQLSTF